MRKINAPLFLTACVLFISLYSFGQRNSNDKWFVDINTGPTIFIGDIRSADFFPSFTKPAELGFAFGGIFGKEMGTYFNIRSQFIYGTLSGVKPVSDLNFKTKFLSAGLGAEFNLNYLFTGNNRSDLIVFGTIGANYTNWNADLIKTSTSIIQNNDKSGAIAIPVGLKILFELSSNLFLSMEGALHIVTSDLVDAKPGGIAHDDISYNSLGLTYKFDKIKKRRKTLQPQISRNAPTIAPAIEDAAEINETEVAAERAIAEKEEEQARLQAEAEKRIEEKLLANLIEQERKNEIHGFVGEKTDYRVSILSTIVETDPVKLQKQLQIPETITEIQYSDGRYNYLVGSFDKSWKAKELRNMLISVNNVTLAKVVLFKEGKTMQMQDAYNLAVAAQQRAGDTTLLKNSIYESVELVHNIPEKGLFFGVQILSMQKDAYPLQLIVDLYDLEGNIVVDRSTSWSRLIIDEFKSLDEAIKAKFELRKKGFTDAFVIAFYNGSRIPPSKISEYMNNEND